MRRQVAELEGLRRRLDKVQLALPKTPRLTSEALAEFRGRGRLAGWGLDKYVQAVPMEGSEDHTPEEVMALKVWDTMWDNDAAYAGRQQARQEAESEEGKQLDALP